MNVSKTCGLGLCCSPLTFFMLQVPHKCKEMCANSNVMHVQVKQTIVSRFKRQGHDLFYPFYH